MNQYSLGSSLDKPNSKKEAEKIWKRYNKLQENMIKAIKEVK